MLLIGHGRGHVSPAPGVFERCTQRYWLERETKLNPQNIQYLVKTKIETFFPKYFSVTADLILLVTVVGTALSIAVWFVWNLQPFKARNIVIRNFCFHINRSKTFKTIQSVFNTNSVQLSCIFIHCFGPVLSPFTLLFFFRLPFLNKRVRFCWLTSETDSCRAQIIQRIRKIVFFLGEDFY